LGLGRQFGQIHFGAFGEFSADLSAPIVAGTVSPSSMFSINQPLFLQKLSFYIQNPNIYFIWDWDLNFGCKEVGV
jgi:hypothetical protein